MSRRVPRFFHESSRRRADRFRTVAVPDSGARQPGLLVVGTGMMGRERIRIAELMGRARVVGLYDICKASLKEAEQACGPKPHRYESLQQACGDSAVDAIVISSPNYTHFDIVRVVRESGKPLLLDKPMATTLADAAQIARMAADYPSFIQIGMQYRYKCQYVDAFTRSSTTLPPALSGPSA